MFIARRAVLASPTVLCSSGAQRDGKQTTREGSRRRRLRTARGWGCVGAVSARLRALAVLRHASAGVLHVTEFNSVSHRTAELLRMLFILSRERSAG